MDAELAGSLIEALGSVPTYRGDKVSCPCVLAPWTHAKGQDSNPSGAIIVDDKGARYNCFSCTPKSIPVLELLLQVRQHQILQPLAKIDLEAARQIVIHAEQMKQDPLVEAANEIAEFGAFQPKQVDEPFKPWPEHWLQSFAPAHGLPYAYERGLTDELIAKLELKYDRYQQRLCEPYRTFDGQLAGFHGRLIGGIEGLRYYAYDCGVGRNPHVWMGEHLCDINYPIVLTEGQFDKSQIYQAYPNVLASRSASISGQMMRRLHRAKWLITMYDHGTGGDNARSYITRNVDPSVKVYHLKTPSQEVDYGDMPPSFIHQQLAPILGAW
jgi:DNA primase